LLELSAEHPKIMTSNTDQFAGARIFVLGDCMLDRYLHGTVGRISPEAPVPIVTLVREANYLGGMGNVAAGIAALGSSVTAAGVIGDDSDGRELHQLLATAGVAELALVANATTRTICKTRVVAGKYQQLLRIDQDGDKAAIEAAAMLGMQDLLARVTGQDAVVLADYDKGNLPPALVARVIQACAAGGVPCIVDPKKTDFSVYSGATIMTPNLLELERSLGRPLGSEAAIIEAAFELREKLNLTYMLVTRGSDGMLLATETGATHIPAEVREVADVTGAGDTVVSVLAACLARRWDIVEACQLASLAAGIAVAKPRTYVVKAAELAQVWKGQSLKILDWKTAAARVAEVQRTGHSVVFTNGCFDILHAGHLSCLERARKLGDLLVLGLNSDASVRSNKGDMRPAMSETHRAALLAGLACVDIVTIFDDTTPEALIRLLKPDVLVKGADYDAETIAGAEFVRSRGGRVVTLPLVEGLSTIEPSKRADIIPHRP
jgi:D-beta-D-heptose 7-phosphate kinase/D-beta-D-heptose 1-phosphate adenosyltransferase